MNSKSIFQAVTRWDNAIIEVVSLLVIIVSAILTAAYFGFGQSPIITIQAVVYAAAVDGLFYVAVRLTRSYLSGGSVMRVLAGLFWFGVSIAAGLFTWHNNLLFAAESWHLDAAALTRAGVTDGMELQLHAIIPVAAILFCAIFPRHKTVRTPEQILEDARQQQAMLEAKNILRGVNAAGAGAALRTMVGGFANNALNLQEKKTQEDARWTRRNDERRMRDLAGEELQDECRDDDGNINYAELAQRLRQQGRLQDNAQPQMQEDTQEEISDPRMDAVTDAGKPKWLTAEEVAQELGISLFQAAQRMKPDYRGRYSHIKARKFTVRGKPVYKAYYKFIDGMKGKETAQSEIQVSA